MYWHEKSLTSHRIYLVHQFFVMLLHIVEAQEPLGAYLWPAECNAASQVAATTGSTSRWDLQKRDPDVKLSNTITQQAYAGHFCWQLFD